MRKKVVKRITLKVYESACYNTRIRLNSGYLWVTFDKMCENPPGKTAWAPKKNTTPSALDLPCWVIALLPSHYTQLTSSTAYSIHASPSSSSYIPSVSLISHLLAPHFSTSTTLPIPAPPHNPQSRNPLLASLPKSVAPLLLSSNSDRCGSALSAAPS